MNATQLHAQPLSDSHPGSGHGTDVGEYVPRPIPLRRARRNTNGNGFGAGVDRAETAIQETEEALMAADLKYNAALEAQNVVVLHLNEPVKHVSHHYFTGYVCTIHDVFCHWRPTKAI